MHRRALLTTLTGFALSACATPASPAGAGLDVRFEYSGADLLVRALQSTSISDAEIDALFANRGARAMIDNTIKYIPQPPELFRTALREYVETRSISAGRFGLVTAGARLAQAQGVLEGLRAHEANYRARIQNTLAPLWPAASHTIATCHFVIAGASDGFVLDADARPDGFVAVDRAEGAHDVDGVVVNVAHEIYHVGQKTARAAAGLHDALNVTSAPPLDRLLVSVLDEGSANYAVDTSRMQGTGPYFEMWRDRFLRNADPTRIGENFALFDRIFAGLAGETMNWPDAYAEGFSGANDARLYFVGYEMVKAMHAAHGARAVQRAFSHRPERFFREYVELSRSGRYPRFAVETEAAL